MLAVGQFLSTFGVKGLIKFSSYSGDVEHLTVIKTFYTDMESTKHVDSVKSYEVEAWHIQSHKTIRCKIVGFNSPEDVRCFIGQNMYVPREQAVQCEKGEYYVSDLIGMYIVHLGKAIGKITSVFSDAYVPLLEVTIYCNSKNVCANSNKKSRPVKKLIPFMKKFVSEPLKMQEICSSTLEGDNLYGIELYDLAVLE